MLHIERDTSDSVNVGLIPTLSYAVHVNQRTYSKGPSTTATRGLGSYGRAVPVRLFRPLFSVLPDPPRVRLCVV